jgi:hypothetical protein
MWKFYKFEIEKHGSELSSVQEPEWLETFSREMPGGSASSLRKYEIRLEIR